MVILDKNFNAGSHYKNKRQTNSRYLAKKSNLWHKLQKARMRQIMDIKLKKSIIATSIVLSATSVGAAQGFPSNRVLLPSKAIVDGLSYDNVYAILSMERVIEYGTPVSVQINENEGTMDLSSFDDFVVRIPLEQALVQPNRTEPTK